MNKLKSRRFWVVVWACLILTISVSIKYDATWLAIIAGVPVAWIGFESNNKKYYKKEE